MKRAAVGFTLIELMIVVAVIAILATIAYPSYVEHVRKSRRAQAKADLVEYMQLAERSHTVENTYTKFLLSASQQRSPREGGTVFYKVEIAPAATGSAINIKATPQNGQQNDKCGTLQLNQAGVKLPTSPNDCW